MTVLREMHMGVGTEGGFSNYFLAHVPEKLSEGGAAVSEVDVECGACCIELTHNHGTENDPDFK